MLFECWFTMKPLWDIFKTNIFWRVLVTDQRIIRNIYGAWHHRSVITFTTVCGVYCKAAANLVVAWCSPAPLERSLGVLCLASAVSNVRLLAAHCRHSHVEVSRQCEADMSGKSMPHHEETGALETQRPASYRLYIIPVSLHLMFLWSYRLEMLYLKHILFISKQKLRAKKQIPQNSYNYFKDLVWTWTVPVSLWDPDFIKFLPRIKFIPCIGE